MPDSLENWFKREILQHEGALLRYLSRMWPRRHEIDDLCQDAYARVYEAAARNRPRSPRSFLFTTAHHLMIDRLRRERVVSIEAVGDMGTLDVLVDEITSEQRVSARQELKRLAHALDRLPPKCREVVWLRRVEDLPQKEIAQRLGINEKTVEKHISKGSRLLAAYLLGAEAATGESAPTHESAEKHSHEHGKP